MNVEAYIAHLGSMATGERHRFIEAEPLPVSVGALLDQAAAEAPSAMPGTSSKAKARSRIATCSTR